MNPITYRELLEMIASENKPYAVTLGEVNFPIYYWSEDAGEFIASPDKKLAADVAHLGTRYLAKEKIINFPEPKLTRAEVSWLKTVMLPWSDKPLYITKDMVRSSPYLVLRVEHGELDVEEMETPLFDREAFAGMPDGITFPLNELLGWEVENEDID